MPSGLFSCASPALARRFWLKQLFAEFDLRGLAVFDGHVAAEQRLTGPQCGHHFFERVQVPTERMRVSCADLAAAPRHVGFDGHLEGFGCEVHRLRRPLSGIRSDAANRAFHEAHVAKPASTGEVREYERDRRVPNSSVVVHETVRAHKRGSK
jgi:hypothetical protein